MYETADTNSKSLIEELSGETVQEQAANTGEGSYLRGLENNRNFTQREKEYIDPEKQFVRQQWLRLSKDLHTTLGHSLKYLTLPAYLRLDITMMMNQGLLALHNDGARTTLSVAAFEADPGKFSRMTGATPDFQLFGNCTLEDALTLPDNPYFSDLFKMFPFDVVNFDLTSSLTPKHEGPYSRVMQALEEVFKRQAPRHEEWILFLTFRNMEAEWESTALKSFITNLQANLDTWPGVRDVFVNKLHQPTAEALHASFPATAIVQSVGKWLVDRAHFYGHSCLDVISYHYERPNVGIEPYTISKLLMRFKREQHTTAVIPMKQPVPEKWKENDLVRCIERNKHQDVRKILEKPGLRDTINAQIFELVASFEETYTRHETPLTSPGMPLTDLAATPES